jgi:hypothetical protein
MLYEVLEGRRLLTTYYVDPAGDDANAGLTPDDPWKSVARVSASTLRPGDAVLFSGGGVFQGTLSLGPDDAGSPQAPVLVSSYGAGRATIHAGNADGISVYDTAGVTISNLAVVGSGQAPATHDGIAFENDLPGSVKLSRVHIDDVDVSGFGRFGITVGGGGASGKSGFQDVRITRAVSHDNVVAGIETHGVFSSIATGYANRDVYIGHCTVYNNTGYAGSPNHSGDGIVPSDVDGLVIERSVAYNNGAQNTHVGGPVGIWVWDVNNAVIQHNESHHNRTNSTADGGGFDIDGGVTNSVMQYNYSHDNDGPGYGIYQFKGARAMTNNVVRYNVSQNDARKNAYGAIDFWNGNGSNGINGVEVYNNTVYLTPSPGADPKAIRFISGTTGVHVRNNTFVTTGGAKLADIGAKHNGLLIQGNNWYSSGAAFRLKYFAKTYSSLAAFRSGTKQETVNGQAVGLQADPQFQSPGAGGTLNNADLLETMTAYDLRATSPLRDAALNLWSRFGLDPGRRDLGGTALPAAGTDAVAHRYDVGADEYS